jgi:hypothetical protein
MLPANLVRLRSARNQLVPQYLDPTLETWSWAAEQLLELYRTSLGRTRGEIDDDVEQISGNQQARLVYVGLAKLLADRSEFDVVSHHPPEDIREAAFIAASRARVTGVFDRDAIVSQVAVQLEIEPKMVDAGLFADLKSEQRLRSFEDFTPRRLIERYNVALVQSILIRAVTVTATVRNASPTRIRQLLRTAKFHRLICEVDQPTPDTLILTLDGPLSLFSATQKYGMQLACFFPTLLLNPLFELRADVRWGVQRREKTLVVSASDGLVSHVADTGVYTPPELAMFAEYFRKKVADWEIRDESEVVPLGRGHWVPDYRLVHKSSGRWVYLEVLGFWRKASAMKHLEALAKYANRPFVLAVSGQLNIDEEQTRGLPAGVHIFKNMPLPDEVVRLAEQALGTA